MGRTLLYPGDLAVELVPARVIVTHEVAGEIAQDSERGEGFFRAGRQGPVPHQPLLRGAHGDHMRRARHLHTLFIEVFAGHVDRVSSPHNTGSAASAAAM